MDPPIPPLDFSLSSFVESRLVEPMDEQWNRIKEVLSCPICLHIFSGPINQCVNGHSVCESCRGKIRKCPLCRGTLTAKCRNFVLETIMSTCKFKCKFFDQGCTACVQISGDEEHRNSCSFRNIQCSSFGFKECPIQTKFSEFSSHLSNVHNVRTEDNNYFTKGNFISRDSLISSTRDRFVDTIIIFDNKKFLLNFEILGTGGGQRLRQLSSEEKNLLPCSWWISLIGGGREEAANYTFRITISSSSTLFKKTNFSLNADGPVTAFRDQHKPILATTLGNILGSFCPIAEESLNIGVPEIRYKINAVIFKKTEPKQSQDVQSDFMNLRPQSFARIEKLYPTVGLRFSFITLASIGRLITFLFIFSVLISYYWTSI